MNENDVRVYIGTYTQRLPHADSKGEGIYVCDLDMRTGELVFISKLIGIVNPSYLAIEPQQRYLYAVSEVEEHNGKPGGIVGAFQIDSQTGDLTPINQQSSHGTAPCYVSIDQNGKWALVANYGSGSAATYPINADGSLGEAHATIQHEGSSINPNRQEGPHAHCIVLDPTNQYVSIADLGLDKVLVYSLNQQTGQLSPTANPSVAITPGSGPRHLAFHPDGHHVYVINEMASTITAFAYEDGNYRELQTISTLPDDFDGISNTAAIHVAPSGRFVYGSNRGHDSIAIFACDAATGRLTAIGHESTQGKTPRDFVIDPTGTYLLAANQDTDTVISYRIDQETGALSATGYLANVPTPVCLKAIKL